MAGRTYVFAGGGTGGHLYPGLAVAAALREREPDASIVFLTTQRPLDRQLLSGTPYVQIEQVVRPFTVHPLRLLPFFLAWRQSVSAASRLLRERSVAAVVGLGGYAAGPAVHAAHRLGIRAAILNPDAVPGRANRYLARRASMVVLQWDASRVHFPSGAACRTLGCPIRPEFGTASAATGRAHFGLDPDRPVILVTGASQGARSVNETMTLAWPRLSAEFSEWQVVHLTGAADESAVRSAYAAARIDAHVLPFTREMALAIAAADVVVSRAGASTLAELTALGRASVLLPYPYHRDRHQHANAHVLEAEGAAVVVEDLRSGTANLPAFSAALRSVMPPDVRARMGEAARKLGRPRAAEAVAGWLSAGDEEFSADAVENNRTRI